ncbi:hypothetical protein E3N88_25714 [Mikania micrantha]|uniref:Uncharacterized protein n=1 Tax=Mikania micrantha TaxID=192012 RepID=A0A5N6N6X9_9ASTR|nr:hypothetical protein E3N88_25714 [Mikania micrantha]
MVTDTFKTPVHTTLPFGRSSSPFSWAVKKGNLPDFSGFDPYEQSDSIHDRSGWEADNPLDQDDSLMKVIHEEHSVMLQDLSKTHSTKVALNLWLFDKKAAFQWVDMEQYLVPSNSVIINPFVIEENHHSCMK